MGLRKIIVLIPVKNEAWIMQVFLQVTSQFADVILVADQHSEDETVAIVKTFPKAILLQNPSAVYNNATRQKFLIDEARTRFPGNHVILALDADEIASADSLQPAYWDQLRALPPGILLYFRKSDLINNGKQVHDLPESWYPLGFVDDGLLQHSGKPMHSVRIPLGGAGQPKVNVSEIFFLHLQRLRPKTQEAKRRFYQVKERDFGMNRWYWRRKRYNRADFLGLNIPIKDTPMEWLHYPQQMGVHIDQLCETETNWFDREVLYLLQKNGGRTYWLDDIWEPDWNSFTTNGKRIYVQPYWLNRLLWLADQFFNKLYTLKQKWHAKKNI